MQILEFIGDAGAEALDLLEAVLNAGYGASFSKIDYELSKVKRERRRGDSERESKKQTHQRYFNMLYKLKRDGLITEKSKKERKFFILTRKGIARLQILKKRSKRPPLMSKYPKASAETLIIVIFDIPEKQRWKRNWLRAVLIRLGFTMLQKSVFIGKVKMSKEFLDDLRALGLTQYIEIFEIKKTGSLEHIL